MVVKTLTINDQLVSARPEQTLLETAKDADIHIPTLCSMEGISSIGACRMCLVEVAGSTQLLPACVTLAEEGMVVQTHTERLQRYRRLVVELLFAEGNHICAICVANGHCELQDLAVEMGIDHVQLPYQFPHRQVDISHPRFGLDPNRCVLCTRCIRVCDELEGAHTWDMADRGRDAHIISDLNQPWGQAASCTACGKCVNACPTGALFHKGTTVGEQHRNLDQLRFIATAQRQRQWFHDMPKLPSQAQT